MGGTEIRLKVLTTFQTMSDKVVLKNMMETNIAIEPEINSRKIFYYKKV